MTAEKKAKTPLPKIIVTDEQALFAAFPQFFKTVPNMGKIRKALNLNIEVPGVEVEHAVTANIPKHIAKNS